MNGQQLRLLAAPALSREDWLPAGEWDALDELRDEHLRLLAVRAEAEQEGARIRHAFAAEDEAQRVAAEAIAAGERVEMPPVTPEAEREAAFVPVKARLDAINERLADYAKVVLDTVERQADTWLDDLTSQAEEADEEMPEALARYEQIKAVIEERRKLRMWIARTADRDRLRAMPFRPRIVGASYLGVRTNETEPADDADELEEVTA